MALTAAKVVGVQASLWLQPRKIQGTFVEIFSFSCLPDHLQRREHGVLKGSPTPVPTHMPMHTYPYAHTPTSIYTDPHTHTCTHTRVPTHTTTSIPIQTYTHGARHPYIRTVRKLRQERAQLIQTYIHTYIHMHTYTRTWLLLKAVAP